MINALKIYVEDYCMGGIIALWLLPLPKAWQISRSLS